MVEPNTMTYHMMVIAGPWTVPWNIPCVAMEHPMHESSFMQRFMVSMALSMDDVMHGPMNVVTRS